MDELSATKLREILKKAKTDALLDHEIAFVRARVDYLNPEQKELVKEYLTVSNEEKRRKEARVYAKTEAEELDADEANRTTHPSEKREQVPYRELQEKAKALGLPYVGVSRIDLEKI